MKLSVKTWNRVRPRTTVKLYDNTSSAVAGAGAFQINPYSQMGEARNDEGIKTSRAFRAAIPWLAAGIDIRSEGVIFAEKVIASKDAETELTQDEKELADYIDAFFNKPDPGGYSTNAQRLFGPWIGDALIVGRGVIRKYLDDNDMIERLRTYDARRLKDNNDYDFDDQEAQEKLNKDGTPAMPRYYYMDIDEKTGILSPDKGEPLMAKHVALLEPTPTSYTKSGLSPLTYLDAYLAAHQEVFRSIRQVQVEGQPPGVFKIPSAQPATIAKLQSEWKRRAKGKVSTVFASLPADTEWVAMGDTNLASRGAFSFMDIIVRGVAAALRISTVALGWTQTTLERNAAAQGENQDEGQFNLLRMVQACINSDILPFFQGSENLIWQYTSLPSDDEAENAETLAQWSGGHFVIPSPDELRKRGGFDPIERKKGTPLDQAYQEMWVVTGGGPVPMSIYLGLVQMQPVPGYDQKTGEVDKEAGLAEQKLKQDTLAPPLPPGTPGAPKPGTPTNGQNGAANGSQKPRGTPATLTALKPVAKPATKMADSDKTPEEIAAELAAALDQEYPWSRGPNERRPNDDDGDDAA